MQVKQNTSTAHQSVYEQQAETTSDLLWISMLEKGTLSRLG